MKNKICLVTGANSGVGKETAKQLAELDAHVVMVVRNETKGRQALEEIKSSTRKESLELMICDFSSQKSIRTFVSSFLKKNDRLDVLVNNHGLMSNKKIITEDGYESTFAVNHLGFFLLTNLLLDLLKKSAPSRIINVSSGAYGAVRKWSLDDYNWDARKFSSFRAYSESKLYNIMFTQELAHRLKDSKITVNAYSPGFTRSNFGKTNFIMKASLVLMFPFAKSPAKSAKTAIYLASSSELENISGKFFESSKIKKTNEMANDKDFRNELWELSEKLVQIAK
ncbi:MAG TPA: SDR family NAD(P)-dependent oxidoreductase [candidate division Zixibacteria bacterium]|nr:SDR family NAD(P)-dependent oxidoreductase [candidate division Zixibacteria bacterium]